MLIGHLGKDPDVRYTGSGLPVANFSIATNERRKGEGGNWEDRTEWHDIVAFGKLADICGQYLSKGRQVYVEGRLQTRSWTDKEGQKRYRTEVICNEMVMLGGPGGGGPRGGGGGGGGPRPSDQGGPGYDDAPMGGSVADDDDIPF